MNKKILTVSALILVCTSCSSFSRRNEDASAPAAVQETEAQKIERLEKENKALAASLSNVSTKLESIETKLSSMNDKIDSTKSRMDNLVDNTRAKPKAPTREATEGAIALPPAGEDEAEAAFTADEPVQKYRQAMILFNAKNYADASLGFSAFVEKYPDHALAGSAQFYLGESYLKQNEFKLAAREFGRVITTYDRSPHIAETLRDLAFSEEKNGQTAQAEKHRQLLTSLFPHSPAAHAEPGELDAVPSETVEKKSAALKPSAGEEPVSAAGAEAPAAATTSTNSAAPETPAQEMTTTNIGKAGEAPAAQPGAPSANHASDIDGPPPTAPMENGHQ